LFGDLSSDELNWIPSDKTWNIAQNLEHIILINTSYFPIIQSIKEGTYKIPFPGRFRFVVNFFGKILLKAVQPNGKKRTKTLSIWEPPESEVDPEYLLIKFEEHQETFKEVIANSEDLLRKETVISSPANKNIVYSLKTAFDILVAHEQRHLEQSKEILCGKPISVGKSSD